ncbi:MAG TPA: hypothetical protein VFG53_17895 [Anaeromyxobacter sp.]|nr:hypothetical protein [Anaeromyxobacter sp.]
MADPIETRLVDKRVAHRYLRKGLLDEKEYERHMKSLPDLSDQALSVEASIEGQDLREDEAEPGEVAPAGAGAPQA